MTVRLRLVAEINPNRASGPEGDPDTAVSFLPMELVGFGGRSGPGEVVPLSQVHNGFTRFEEGDVLLAKITPSFENGKGSLASGLVNGIGFGTTELHVLRPKLIDRRYLNWLVQSAPFRMGGAVEMRGAAGQQRVPADYVSNYHVPASDDGAQRMIADFLDRETQRIDGLVDAKRRIIDLLEEKRDAAVDLATAGHGTWPMVSLQHLVSPDRPITYGIVLPGPSVDHGVPIVKSGDVKPGRLHPDRLDRTTVEIESHYLRSRIRPGDLVYSIRGSVGSVEIVPETLPMANLTQDTARIAPGDQVSRDWLLHALRSSLAFSELEAGMTGAAVKGVNIFSLNKLRLPLPPFDVQRAIATELNALTAAIGAAERALTRQLALLAEYRQALITKAVTGHLDEATLKGKKPVDEVVGA